jgi:hypothetical protein
MENILKKLNFLEESLLSITIIPSNIDINYFRELFNQANSTEEKIAICEKFIMSIKLNDKR